MIKWINNIWRRIKYLTMDLISASKNTETQVLTSGGTDGGDGLLIVQDVNQGAHVLSKALLKGELNEEVMQLRYRTYKVDREAKQYKYYAPTLAIKKKHGKDNKFMSYDKSDGLDIITIQENYPLKEDVTDGMTQIINGGRGEKTNYKIEITRDFIPRFRIEEFLKKLVVKRLDDTHVILDFYFSKYPDDTFLNNNDVAFRSKPFIHEIEKICNGGVRSDILNMERVRFVTSHAYKLDDLIEFTFKNVWFKEVAEYDGDYILRFKASLEHNAIDLTAPFYNKKMDDKYKNKEKKDVIFDITGNVPVETYICSDCGKKVTFDAEKIDETPISQPRDIDENQVENEKWNVLEYVDMQIVEQTIGKKLCKTCLKKYLDNRGLK